MKSVPFHALLLIAYLSTNTNADTVTAEPPSFYNGFDVAMGLIAPNELDHGGPGRDGIPALDDPKFVTAAQGADQIKPGDRVLGVSYNGVAKAYPIAILEHHEIVNDRFADTALTITFGPLCGTGMVFLAEAGDQVLNFGVSGLIYNSNMLLYDRNTLSLWSQLMKKAVTGPLRGTTLSQLPAQYSTWDAWLLQHPQSLLLSRDTGYQRDYDTSPYFDYKRLPAVTYATLHSDWRLSAKTWVVGITVGDEALALPIKDLDTLEDKLAVSLGGQALEIQWDKTSDTARAFEAGGKEIPTTSGYWFAWVAFHPTTALYLGESAN